MYEFGVKKGKEKPLTIPRAKTKTSKTKRKLTKAELRKKNASRRKTKKMTKRIYRKLI